VIATDSTSEEAFNRANFLLKEVKLLEALVEIPIPDIKNQTINGGYHREVVDALKDSTDMLEVEYQNINDIFHITAIKRKDNEDFYYLEESRPLSDKHKFIESKNGYDIYAWDTIGPLCGSSGLLVVKDGMIIKQKMLYIS
jgi:hypothetical protein